MNDFSTNEMQDPHTGEKDDDAHSSSLSLPPSLVSTCHPSIDTSVESESQLQSDHRSSSTGSSEYIPVPKSVHKWDDPLAICPRITCEANGIVKLNPKYALSCSSM